MYFNYSQLTKQHLTTNNYFLLESIHLICFRSIYDKPCIIFTIFKYLIQTCTFSMYYQYVNVKKKIVSTLKRLKISIVKKKHE